MASCSQEPGFRENRLPSLPRTSRKPCWSCSSAAGKPSTRRSEGIRPGLGTGRHLCGECGIERLDPQVDSVGSVGKWCRVAVYLVAGSALAHAQIAIVGRVVDEHGAGVPGARVLLREGSADPSAASSDLAGNFKITLP